MSKRQSEIKAAHMPSLSALKHFEDARQRMLEAWTAYCASSGRSSLLMNEADSTRSAMMQILRLVPPPAHG